MISFSELGLLEPLQKALSEENYTHPTPIQAQSIPHLLEGRDLLGCARTGTGKTAAFVLPILQRLSASAPRPSSSSPRHSGGHHASGRAPRALVLVPTRELAAQVGESLAAYGRHMPQAVAVVYGGVGQAPQVRALTKGVDVVVATPGRLLDLMNQGHARLDRLEILVLDEADQMLDLGFLPDVKRILRAVPAHRQTLLFSATMPTAIAALADGILTRPVKVVVTPAASTVDEVEQRVHYVDRSGKPDLLARVLSEPGVERALVFTRTKRGADRVARRLNEDGIRAEAIHGNKSQGQRERTLLGFRRGRTRVLVATDIAARGIDVDGITHVVNYELPNVPESYVHRIGRTARAGATGVAISLCDGEERAFLRDIERLIKRKVQVVGREPEERSAPARHAHARSEPSRNQNGHAHRSGGGGRYGHSRRGKGSHHASARHPAANHGSGNHRSGHHGSTKHRPSHPRPVHAPRGAAHAHGRERAASAFGEGVRG